MRGLKTFSVITNRLFNTEYRKAKIRARFLITVIGTDIFSRLTIQDKIISLAKLVALFEKEFGFAPKTLVRMLVRLNRQLNGEISKNWYTTYSN